MAAITTVITDADVAQMDHSFRIVRVKGTGMMKEAGTVGETGMAAETGTAAAIMITIVAETVILTVTMITTAAEALILIPMAILSPVMIPDRLTIRAADVTINNNQNAALSFGLT